MIKADSSGPEGPAEGSVGTVQTTRAISHSTPLPLQEDSAPLCGSLGAKHLKVCLPLKAEIPLLCNVIPMHGSHSVSGHLFY